jgi:UrcA family protein
MRTITLVLTTIISAGLSAQALSAGTGRDAERSTKTVRFADLNLARPEGAETLYQRLEAAARSVCGRPSDVEGGARGAKEKARRRECADQAVADAVNEVNRPQLVAVHLGAKQRGSKRGKRRA